MSLSFQIRSFSVLLHRCFDITDTYVLCWNIDVIILVMNVSVSVSIFWNIGPMSKLFQNLFTIPAVPTVCFSNPKESATISEDARRYISVMVTLSITYSFN